MDDLKLPEPYDAISVLVDGGDLLDVDVFSADQMRAYAAAAIRATSPRTDQAPDPSRS